MNSEIFLLANIPGFSSVYIDRIELKSSISVVDVMEDSNNKCLTLNELDVVMGKSA